MKLNATLARRGALVALAASVAACGQNVLVGGKDHGGAPSDAGAESDSATSKTDGEIVCGPTRCTPVDVGGGLGVREPCCVDFSRCGAKLPNICVELDSPGAQSAICPAVTSYPGCCRPNGNCGLLLTGTRFGCIDPFQIFPTVVLPTCAPRDQ